MREGIFKKLFFRGDTETPLHKWLAMLPLELYIGEHLLEMLSNTASYNHEMTTPRINNETNGWRRPLEEFIPATLFNKLAIKRIIELLENKYIAHYQLIKEVVPDEPALEVGPAQPDGRYELNHGNLHLLTELKLTYNTTWVALNCTIDVMVYIATNDLATTLLAGALVEFIRRFKL